MTTVTTEQRFADKAKTQPIPDHVNVFRDGKYIGSVYKSGVDQWQWGGARDDHEPTLESAVEEKVKEYEREIARSADDYTRL